MRCALPGRAGTIGGDVSARCTLSHGHLACTFTLAMLSAASRTKVLLVIAFVLGGVAAGTGSLRAAWEPFARIIGLTQPPVPASANVLSEHEIETLDSTPPQAQAELLLERSVNHYRGANDQIAARLHAWRGNIAMKGRLNELFMTAINSNDVTVRVAGVEVDIAARNLLKEPATIDRLEPLARSGDEATRINAMWDAALIGNRGVQPSRVFDILSSGLHDDSESVRSWAAEGLAFLASDRSIAPLLLVLHDDPSPVVRERAACGLAQSGMFSASQRMTAVPALLNFADDGSLDERTRGWVFQALRDITGQSLPRDAVAWRNWYAESGR